MLAQPRFEVSDQLRLDMCRGRVSREAHAALDEVSAKVPGAVDGVVVAPASFGARTPARAQVLAECRQIDVAQAPAALDHDVADMGCSPQIAHGRGWPVTMPSGWRGFSRRAALNVWWSTPPACKSTGGRAEQRQTGSRSACCCAR
jgi:hypothetical protein